VTRLVAAGLVLAPLTTGLVLAPLTTDVVARRLAEDDFTIDVDGVGPVHFGAEYPGDLLALFPFYLAGIPRGMPVDGTWTIIDAAAREAVGVIGTKGPADQDGAVEIGYVVNPSHQGRGAATAATRALVDELRNQGVRTITAETRTGNAASQAVLHKAGFKPIGERIDEHDGTLVTWELALSNAVQRHP